MPKAVWVLSTIAFLVAVGFGVLVPVLPVFAASFGVSNFAVGAVVSAFALMRLVTAPFVPKIVTKFGERVTLGGGIFIVAASSAAAGAATDYTQLLIMRSLGGIGSAMFTVSALALLVKAVDPDHRGRASALYSGGFLLGGMAGPAVGGIFSSISLSAPFYFYAATLLAAGIVGLTLLKDPAQINDPAQTNTDQTGSEESPLVSKITLTQAFKNRTYQAACLTNFAVGWQSYGVRNTLVPTLVVTVLGRPPSWTGISLAIAAVAQGLALGPIGHLIDAKGRKPFIIAGGVITALGALATPFAPNIGVLTIILCIYGVGSAMQTTAPTAAVGDVTGPAGGQPLAVFQMTSDIGSIIGPLIAGWIVDESSIATAFIIGAVLMAVSALFATTMTNTMPQSSDNRGSQTT